MNKKEKEIEKLLLEHEKQAFEEVKKSYNTALKDVKGRLLHLQSRLNELNEIDTTGYDERSLEILQSMKQSKIYQINYQKNLEEQIGACIDVLKKDTVVNIQTYLDSMYKDAYLGNLYNINAKGIPVTTAINPSLLARSVNKKIEDMTFAQRIGVNMNDFKKTIKAEISRGIANGSSYNDIAQQLSMRTGEDLYKSQRIIRTEGGRVSSEARLTSIRDAKEKGADLVKQWDSTLDGKTRDLHIILDGQWTEVDEPFDADGIPVMAPGMFGDPGEDCNCRCVVLSVPRWDIEETVVKWDNENDELIETKNYQEWKQGYYRRAEVEELKENKSQDYVNYINSLKPQVDFGEADLETIKYWEEQILQGNHRPIMVDINDPSRIVDGNHTMVAYNNLGLIPENVYMIDRRQLFNDIGNRVVKDEHEWIKKQIEENKVQKIFDYKNSQKAIELAKSKLPKETTEHFESIKDTKKFEKLSKLHKITDKEKDLIYENDFAYIGSEGSFTINQMLRDKGYREALTEEALEEFDKTIDTLKNVINRNTIDFDAMSYRFVRDDYLSGAFDTTDVEKLKELIGSTIEEKAFTSASLIREQNSFKEFGVEIDIKIPKGTNAYIADNTSESEIILNTNTKFIIEDIDYADADGEKISKEEFDKRSEDDKKVKLILKVIQ